MLMSQPYNVASMLVIHGISENEFYSWVNHRNELTLRFCFCKSSYSNFIIKIRIISANFEANQLPISMKISVFI